MLHVGIRQRTDLTKRGDFETSLRGSAVSPSMGYTVSGLFLGDKDHGTPEEWNTAYATESHNIKPYCFK